MKKKNLLELQYGYNEYGTRYWKCGNGEFSEFDVPYGECRTQGLLELLNLARSKQGKLEKERLELVKKQEELRGIMHRLKTELATREHIPNKQEKKEIRRKKAQGKYVKE